MKKVYNFKEWGVGGGGGGEKGLKPHLRFVPIEFILFERF